MKVPDYLMKMNFVQPLLEATELLHRFHHGFQLLDDGVHGVLLVIHLLSRAENALRPRSGNDGDAVAVSDHDVAGG